MMQNFTLLVHMTKREIAHIYGYTVVWAVLFLPMRSAQFPRTKLCEFNMGRSGGTTGEGGGGRTPPQTARRAPCCAHVLSSRHH